MTESEAVFEYLDPTIKFKFTSPTTAPDGKVAEVEMHFIAGPLEGLKLIGFGLWKRRSGSGYNVTYPARTYRTNGETRSFALLRPIATNEGHQRLTDQIVAAYLKTQTPEP